jgi:hypothetical protein
MSVNNEQLKTFENQPAGEVSRLLPSDTNRFIPTLDGHMPADFLTPEDIRRKNLLAKVEAVHGPIAQLTVPHQFLHGEHAPSHFKHTRLKRVNRGFKAYPIPKQLLLNNPIEVVFLPEAGLIPIFQGHHRARVAPKYGVKALPALVHTLPQAVHLSNLLETRPQNAYDEDSLRHDLIQRAEIARELFLKSGMDDNKTPYLVEKATSVGDLPVIYPDLFQEFELFSLADHSTEQPLV